LGAGFKGCPQGPRAAGAGALIALVVIVLLIYL
jgi:hypothetical protein